MESLETRVMLSYTVTTTADSTADNGMGGNPLSLREAIAQANATEAPQTINFASSLAGDTINLSEGSLTVEDVFEPITINGPQSGITINQTGSNCVFDFETPGNLSNLTITGGNGSNGSGIITGSSLTLTNCVVTDNTNSTQAGGGIRDEESPLTIINSTISGNSGTSGGGIYLFGNTLDLYDSTVSGNSGSKGAGIFLDASASLITANIVGSTISGNTASSNGGGISTTGTASLSLDNSTVSGNSSSKGAGIFFDAGSSVSATIVASTISGNTASSSGGGLYSYFTALSIVNSTISGNSAGGSGGGIYNYYGHLNESITDSTIANNTADTSGAGISVISTDHAITLSGSIVANNTIDATEEDLSGPSGAYTGSYNLVGDATGSSVGLSSGNNVLDTAADLAPLGSYGGPTETMGLLPGSPAIAAGATFTGMYTDQRGFYRPSSGVDIGAFQNSPTTVSVAISGPSSGYITLTATVLPDFNNWGYPTGTVTFMDGSTNLGSSTLNGSGVGTITISALTDGSHSITAVYSGDPSFLSSTSVTVTQNDTSDVTVTGQTFMGTAEQAVSASVAYVTDPDGQDGGTQPGQLTALINWGDGAITGGLINQDETETGGFDVTGTHIYSSASTYTVSVAITADDSAGYSFTDATSTAIISPIVSSFSVNDGSSDRTSVTSLAATFSEAQSLTAGDFQIMQTASTNSVSAQPITEFQVSASDDGTVYTLTFPDYADSSLPNGTYTVTVLGVSGTEGQLSNPQYSFYCESSGAADGPTISLQTVPTATAGSPVTISATAAPYGNNNDLLKYQWSVTGPDGSVSLPGNGVTDQPSLIFTPDANHPGDYSVSVTATDTDLNLSASSGPEDFTVGNPAASSLTATFDSNGLSDLGYGSTTFATGSNAELGYWDSEILVVTSDGNQVAETISSISFTSSNDTASFTATPTGGSSPDFTFDIKYSTENAALNYTICVHSSENNTSDYLEGFWLWLVTSPNFPTSPFTNGQDFAWGTLNPLFVPAAYGSGSSTGVMTVASQEQGPGYVGFYGAGDNFEPVFTTLPSRGNSTNVTSEDSPVGPGGNATYDVSLFFGTSTTDPQLTQNQQEINQEFAAAYPSTLQWEDRSWMDSLFPNPTGGDDTDVDGFASGLLNSAAGSIDDLLENGGQGMIVWDIESQPEYGNSWVADPRLATQFVPDLGDQMPALTSLDSADQAEIGKYYVPLGPGGTVLDEYFKMFTNAGLKVGVALRPDQTFYVNDEDVDEQFTGDAAQLLIQKIEYAESQWGATLFYIDSVASNYTAILAEVQAALPNVLLIPEEQTVSSYAFGAAYGYIPDSGTSSLTTASNIVAVYPNAFTITRTESPGQDLSDSFLTTAAQAIDRGDTFMTDGNSTSESTFLEAISDLAFYNSTITDSNGTKEALDDGTITLSYVQGSQNLSSGPEYEISYNGMIIETGQLSSTDTLTFDFAGSNNTLVIDTSAGDPIPVDGLHFDGNTTSDNNTLVVVGSDGNDTITVNSGTIAMSTASWSGTITYSNVANLIVEPRGGTDALTVNSGTVELPSQYPGHGILDRVFSSLTVASGAKLVVETAAARSDMTLIKTNTLSVAGTLDLGGNEMIINYGSGSDPIATIRSLLTSGYSSGAWNGTGIDSSDAAANSAFALGYADGADGVVAGLPSGEIEILYTLYGDANLDGTVNSADQTITDANSGHDVTGWDQGDFNYDGVDNGTDIALLDANLGDTA